MVLLRLDDVVARRDSQRDFGVVTRTFRGVVDGLEEEDDEGLNPQEDEVQVAWAPGGEVENVRMRELSLVDRTWALGEFVSPVPADDASPKPPVLPEEDPVGCVVAVQQQLDVALVELQGQPACRPRVIPDVEVDLAEQSGRCDQASRVLPLHVFEEGQAVTHAGWLGCVEQVDTEYTIQVQTGHTFRHAEHKGGVSIERRASVSERFPLYPGQKVVLTEYLASRLVERFTGEEVRTVNLAPWQRGVVLNFEVMAVHVNWVARGSRGRGSRPKARQHPSVLTVLGSTPFRLGEPVYVRSQAASGPADPPSPRPAQMAQYELGVIARIVTRVSVHAKGKTTTRPARCFDVALALDGPIVPGQYVEKVSDAPEKQLGRSAHFWSGSLRPHVPDDPAARRDEPPLPVGIVQHIDARKHAATVVWLTDPPALFRKLQPRRKEKKPPRPRPASHQATPPLVDLACPRLLFLAARPKAHEVEEVLAGTHGSRQEQQVSAAASRTYDHYGSGARLGGPQRSAGPEPLNVLDALDALSPSRDFRGLVEKRKDKALKVQKLVEATVPLEDFDPACSYVEEVPLSTLVPHREWHFAGGDVALVKRSADRQGGPRSPRRDDDFVEVLFVANGCVFCRRPGGSVARYWPHELSVCDLYPDHEELDDVDSSDLSELPESHGDLGGLWDERNAETSRSTTPATANSAASAAGDDWTQDSESD